MNSQPAFVLFNIMILIMMLLSDFMQVKAVPINCSPGTSSPIEGKSLSEIFGDAAKLRDAEALKYFCINGLISSTISTEMVNLHNNNGFTCMHLLRIIYIACFKHFLLCSQVYQRCLAIFLISPWKA